ncbi:hypothetical protein HID58_083783 [Brassica napus]|uniref:BnaC08g43190D protein n=2 Tax=Brassica napus TaxID=3708 RepID=A0A078G8A2_BRANA|nr:hypothetical protein HID58_083783 [Brassica napus]CAF2116203.1 unnamed protein product [Brassica napus]CDY22685.1 BnaC08g43190D [Brassica napus]
MLTCSHVTVFRLEENEKLVLTPFEKNLDICRQLWRVLERSDLIVMVVDARDTLFYRCPDLEIDEHKKLMLLVNKADLFTSLRTREKWAEYFRLNNILFVFWSAMAATALLEGKVLKEQWRQPGNFQKTEDPEVVICGRDRALGTESEEVPGIDDVLDDLSLFDVANGLASSKKVAVKKETASHKQHKKPANTEPLTVR